MALRNEAYYAFRKEKRFSCRLKDSACNSILNLQPPVAGKHPPLTIIDAMVFLSFTTVAPKL